MSWVHGISDRSMANLKTVDGPLPSYFSYLFSCSMQMIFRFTAILIVTPTFVVQGLLIGALGLAIGQAYIKAQLPLKRETSLTRSAVIKHLSEAITGLGKMCALCCKPKLIF